MSENINREIYTELANRIYDLDAEVYHVLGSSLGRTFTGNRDTTIRTLSMLMYTKPDGHLLRSEMALISNMARTIKDKDEKSRLMKKYDEIFQEILTLPETFVATDIMDKERVALNHMIKRREKISENDHLVICGSHYYYNIKVTVKICFVETITFSDQSGESVANHTIPYFFAY